MQMGTTAPQKRVQDTATWRSRTRTQTDTHGSFPPMSRIGSRLLETRRRRWCFLAVTLNRSCRLLNSQPLSSWPRQKGSRCSSHVPDQAKPRHSGAKWPPRSPTPAPGCRCSSCLRAPKERTSSFIRKKRALRRDRTGLLLMGMASKRRKERETLEEGV